MMRVCAPLRPCFGFSRRASLGPLLGLALLACTGNMADGRGEEATHGKGSGRRGEAQQGGAGAVVDVGQKSEDVLEPGAPPTKANFVPGPTVARRLTKEQYAFTVVDQLGVTLGPDADLLPEETRLDGFSGLGSHLTVFSAHAEAYNRLATSITAKMKDLPGFVAKHSDCQDNKAACHQSFVKSVGRLLFRRPLKEDENQAFSDLFATVAQAGGDHSRGARAVIEAMLQSPQFLYRTEIESVGKVGLRVVKDYEMASRLSYLLWMSAPDDELAQAADDGLLQSAADIVKQARRMLGVRNKAQRSSARFVRDWGQLDHLADQGVARRGLNDQMRSELRDSAVAFFQDHAWESALPLADLFTTRRAALGPQGAATYGLKHGGRDPKLFDTEDVPGLVGILTQPGVMAATADREVGGMVARGLYLEDAVFCADPTPPPPAAIDVNANREHLGSVSQRAYAEDRIARGECGVCHGRFEPLAFGFERYDGLGRFVEKDEEGNVLRQDGWIPESIADKKLPYKDVGQYMELVSGLPMVARCMSEKQLEFALGRKLGEDDDGGLDEVHERFEKSAGGLADMYETLVSSAAFRIIPTE